MKAQAQAVYYKVKADRQTADLVLDLHHAPRLTTQGGHKRREATAPRCEGVT